MCLTYFETQNILHTKYVYWYMINSEDVLLFKISLSVFQILH